MLYQEQTRRSFAFLPVSAHCYAHSEKALPPLIGPAARHKAVLYCITDKVSEKGSFFRKSMLCHKKKEEEMNVS